MVTAVVPTAPPSVVVAARVVADDGGVDAAGV